MAAPPSSRRQGVPEILYGTAFKFERSATLVEAALTAGFRALDTAGSKSAYREALVGEGIAAAMAAGSFERSELFVCTRFLYISVHHSIISEISSQIMRVFKMHKTLTGAYVIFRSRPNSPRSKRAETLPYTRMTIRRVSQSRLCSRSSRRSQISVLSIWTHWSCIRSTQTSKTLSQPGRRWRH